MDKDPVFFSMIDELEAEAKRRGIKVTRAEIESAHRERLARWTEELKLLGLP